MVSNVYYLKIEQRTSKTPTKPVEDTEKSLDELEKLIMNSLKESLHYGIKKSDLLLKGIGVSPGIIIGKAFVVNTNEIELSAILLNTEAAINQEIKGLKQALIKSKQQLLKLKRKLKHMKHNINTKIVTCKI